MSLSRRALASAGLAGLGAAALGLGSVGNQSASAHPTRANPIDITRRHAWHIMPTRKSAGWSDLDTRDGQTWAAGDRQIGEVSRPMVARWTSRGWADVPFDIPGDFSLTSVAVDHRGIVWIGGWEMANRPGVTGQVPFVASYEFDRWFPEWSHIPNVGEVWNLQVGPDGALWVSGGDDDGGSFLYRRTPGGWDVYTPPDVRLGYGLAVIGPREAYVSLKGGALLHIDGELSELIPLFDSDDPVNLMGAAADGPTNVWFVGQRLSGPGTPVAVNLTRAGWRQRPDATPGAYLDVILRNGAPTIVGYAGTEERVPLVMEQRSGTLRRVSAPALQGIMSGATYHGRHLVTIVSDFRNALSAYRD